MSCYFKKEKLQDKKNNILRTEQRFYVRKSKEPNKCYLKKNIGFIFIKQKPIIFYCSLNIHALFVAIPCVSYPPVIKTLPSFNNVAVE
jgi:hypothetical protein